MRLFCCVVTGGSGAVSMSSSMLAAVAGACDTANPCRLHLTCLNNTCACLESVRYEIYLSLIPQASL